MPGCDSLLCGILLIDGRDCTWCKEMAKEKHRLYDIPFKLKATETAWKKLNEAAAREIGVDAKRIHEWCDTPENLLNACLD